MINFFHSLLSGWRLRLLWPFLFLLAAFAIFNEFIIHVGGDAQGPVPVATRQASPRPASILFPDPGRMTLVRVVDVLDGDTIDVRLGDDTIRVRYFGSDSPEAGAACADEATQRNRKLVEDNQVYLLPDVRDKDEGGRLLRYVFTLDGRSVDEALIVEGLARAWQRDGAYRDQLIALEEAASAGNLGCLLGVAGANAAPLARIPGCRLSGDKRSGVDGEREQQDYHLRLSRSPAHSSIHDLFAIPTAAQFRPATQGFR